MFFEKILQLYKQKNFHLSSKLLETLKDGGIKANFADLQIGSRGIYFLLPNAGVSKVMLYQAQIQESLFHTKGEPLVHLCSCDESKKNFNHKDFLAIIKMDLRFFLGIYSHKIERKFFNDKPLRLCPQCSEILSHYQENLELFFKSAEKDYHLDFKD